MKLERVIKIKMSGDDVRWIQTKLKEYGFLDGKIDNFFGENTLIAITNFQRKVGIKADGIVGQQTWSQIVNYKSKITENKVIEDKKQTKDIPFKISYKGDNLSIYDCILKDDEYYKTKTKKSTIFLHHTAGGHRADWTINSWDKDFKIDKNGKKTPVVVSTSYVIGGLDTKRNDMIWDGKVLRAFDDNYWAYHLGVSTSNSKSLNSNSIGIEICNYGPLKLGKDGKYYNYANGQMKDEDVVKLKNPFRGYTYWHKYTDSQIESVRNLILYLIDKHDIKIERGIYNEKWFEFDSKWSSLGGLRSHTQVRKDKFDIFPQPEMIDMLNSL